MREKARFVERVVHGRDGGAESFYEFRSGVVALGIGGGVTDYVRKFFCAGGGGGGRELTQIVLGGGGGASSKAGDPFRS